MIASAGLLAALEEVLADQPVKNLRSTSEKLSARYRERAGAFPDPPVRTSSDVYAYAAFRMPATYAAVRAALLETRARRPSWEPRTLLDVGAGPGTAVWAACEIWPSLDDALLLERHGDMIALGKDLARRASINAVRTARWSQTSFPTDVLGRQFDLVVAAYSIGEMEPGTREGVLSWLWAVTHDTLVLVEPGTPQGFSLIRAARSWLISHSGRMTAPCPHTDACPMTEGDWCHFSQRLARSSAHRAAKKAGRGYEDEKYSYVAMSRCEVEPAAGRVIRHPQIRRGHVYLEICAPSGLERRIVTRNNKASFREARELHWGSPLVGNCLP